MSDPANRSQTSAPEDLVAILKGCLNKARGICEVGDKTTLLPVTPMTRSVYFWMSVTCQFNLLEPLQQKTPTMHQGRVGWSSHLLGCN